MASTIDSYFINNSFNTMKMIETHQKDLTKVYYTLGVDLGQINRPSVSPTADELKSLMDRKLAADTEVSKIPALMHTLSLKDPCEIDDEDWPYFDWDRNLEYSSQLEFRMRQKFPAPPRNYTVDSVRQEYLKLASKIDDLFLRSFVLAATPTDITTDELQSLFEAEKNAYLQGAELLKRYMTLNFSDKVMTNHERCEMRDSLCLALSYYRRLAKKINPGVYGPPTPNPRSPSYYMYNLRGVFYYLGELSAARPDTVHPWTHERLDKVANYHALTIPTLTPILNAVHKDVCSQPEPGPGQPAESTNDTKSVRLEWFNTIFRHLGEFPTYIARIRAELGIRTKEGDVADPGQAHLKKLQLWGIFI